MRPIKLELTYFGPFKSETIDFTELHGKMFLLTGPTGSGKSMIFNAILYALYGTDSKHKSLRSQFAKETDKSHVCLEFEMGNKQYRVERTMTVQREDKTDVPPKALLMFANGDTIASGVKAVTDAVLDIIHLNEHQFKQILLLPQGAFKEFLVSSSDEKSKILSTLFHAQRFINFERELEYAMKQKRDDLRTGQMKLDHLFTQVKFERLEENEKWNERYELSVGTEQQILFIEDVNEEAVALIQSKENQLKEIRHNLERMSTSIKEKETHNAEVEKFFLVKQQNEKLDEEKDSIATLKLKVEQCKRAKVMQHQVSGFDKVENDRVDNQTRIEKINTEIETLKKRLGQLGNENEELMSKESHILELREYIQSTYQFFENDEYKNIDKAIAEVRKEVELLSREIESAQVKKQELEQQRDQYKVENEDDTLIKAELEKTSAMITQLQDHAHYNELLSRLHTAESALTDERTQLKELLNRNQGLYSSDDQNAIEHLKQHLAVGDNCPVCQQVLVDIPMHQYFDQETEQEIKEVNLKIESLDKERQKLVIETQLSKDNIEDFVDKSTDVLSHQLESHNELRTTLSQRLENIENKRKSYFKVLEEMNMHASVLSDLNSHYHKELSRLERLKEKYDIFIKATENENYQDFKEKYKMCLETTESYQSKKEKLQNNVQQASQQLALDEQGRNHLLEEKLRLDTVHASLTEELNTFIEQENIENINVLKTFIQTDTSNDETKIDAYEDSVKKVRIQLDAHYENQTTDLKDISDDEREQLQALSQSLEAASNHLTLLKHDLDENKKLYNQFSKLAGSLSEDLTAFNQHHQIYEVVAGKGTHGISLHRFVLTYHLDRVLDHANIRLEEMTNARYTLLRTAEAKRKGTAAGLEIRVHDSFTGMTRHVDTLSGGETFQASLALALAINEIIIQSSGGIQLDTILIDEGFGTLDQETLNQAIESLLSLETSGKMVGIISHVEELKHQLEYKIEVVPQNETSTTILHV